MKSTLIEEVRRLRAAKQLHRRVLAVLSEAIRELFPDWVYVSEVGQTPGGRNDAVLFESGGDSICFELFASHGQVNRDLLLLHESPAKRKIAILLDQEIDPSVSKAYYRRRPYKPYPCIWVSEVLDPDRRGLLQLKLTQYVLQEDLAKALTLSHHLLQASHKRAFREWRDKGIEIYTGASGQIPTFAGVMSLLVVNHMRRLGVAIPACEAAARSIGENFDFLARQILLGVPMLMTWDGKECSILDLSDYEVWLQGSILLSSADHAVVLLNKLYTELRSIYRGDLPDPGDMKRMIGNMLEGRRMMVLLEERLKEGREGEGFAVTRIIKEGDRYIFSSTPEEEGRTSGRTVDQEPVVLSERLGEQAQRGAPVGRSEGDSPSGAGDGDA